MWCASTGAGIRSQRSEPMKRVTGIGGVFFKSEDPEALYRWYETHLGIKGNPAEGATFPWHYADESEQKGMTVWSLFLKHTKYFDPSQSSFMVNYIVDDLDALLKALQ